MLNVQLVCEETVLAILLRAFPKASISLLVEYSDLSGEVTIQVSFAGVAYELEKAEENQISLAIIHTYAKSLSIENIDGKNRIKIII